MKRNAKAKTVTRCLDDFDGSHGLGWQFVSNLRFLHVKNLSAHRKAPQLCSFSKVIVVIYEYTFFI